MELIAVNSAQHSNVVPGWLELVITADLGDGVQQYGYSYNPDESVGLNPEITAWIMSRPDFPIGEADQPPLPPPEPTPAEKLARAGLSVADLKTLLGIA